MERNSTQDIDLREALATFRKRWAIAVLSALLGMAVAGLFIRRQAHLYEATSEIEIVTPSDQSDPISQSLGIKPDTFKRTQVMLLQNPWMLGIISGNLRSRYGIDIDPVALGQRLVVRDQPDGDLIDIFARDHDPKVAQTIANETVSSFRSYVDGVNDTAVKGVQKNMASRVDRAKIAMDRSMSALAAFQAQHGITDLGKQTEANITQVANLQAVATQTRQQLESSASTIAALQQQLNKQNQLIQGSGERNDELIAQLRSHLVDLEGRLNQVEQTYVGAPAYATHPLEAEIADTKSRLQTELSKVTSGSGGLALQDQLLTELQTTQRQQAGLKSQYDAINAQLLQANARSRTMPAIQREFEQLSQNATVDQTVYQKALENFQQIDTDKSSRPSVMAVTGMAPVPVHPVLTSPQLILAIGTGLGFILGLIIIYLLAHFDKRVYGVNELRLLAPEVPILGVLPAVGAADRARILSHVRAADLAAYRALAANVGFLRMGAPIRTLIVTSALPGEGASVTAAHLARALADDGKQVILVDCNLRTPTQTELFGIAARSGGLCEVLGRRISLDEALVRTDEPNLSVLPAGVALPSNPVQMLASEHLPGLVIELLRRADIIVFDTPAVTPLTPDALVLDVILPQNASQAILQVVQANRETGDDIRRVLQQVEYTHSRHAGFVINRATKRTMLEHYGNYHSPDRLPYPSRNGGVKIKDDGPILLSSSPGSPQRIAPLAPENPPRLENPPRFLENGGENGSHLPLK